MVARLCCPLLCLVGVPVAVVKMMLELVAVVVVVRIMKPPSHPHHLFVVGIEESKPRMVFLAPFLLCASSAPAASCCRCQFSSWRWSSESPSNILLLSPSSSSPSSSSPSSSVSASRAFWFVFGERAGGRLRRGAEGTMVLGGAEVGEEEELGMMKKEAMWRWD